VPMPVPSRRTKKLAAVLLLPALLATGCSYGFGAQTNQVYQSAEGANGTSGSIAVRNVLIVADDEGKGKLHGVMLNTGSSDDRLASIEPATGVDGIKITGAEPTPLPPGESVTIGPASSSESGEAGSKAVSVTGAKPGQMIKLTISFGDAGPITAYVPVITEDHYSPSPKPSTGEG
jgi:hypothetical protein